MLIHGKFQKLLTCVVTLTMVFSAFNPINVLAQSGDGLKREKNAQSDRVSFIVPEKGRAVPASQALGLVNRPQDPALALANRYAPEFGLKNPGRDLSQMKTKHSKDGRLTVRYQQNYNGIPVMGGELIVNTNENGDLYSINGEVSPDLSLNTQPTIDAAQAAQTALQAIAKWNQKSTSDFKTTEPQLWIFDESLLQSSTRPTELVWRMDVSAVNKGMPVRELVLVNAQNGTISLHFNQIDTAWTAAENKNGVDAGGYSTANVGEQSVQPVLGSPLVSTYTANHASSLLSLPGTFLCNQTEPTCPFGDAHAKAAHTYAIGTYNLYAAQHNRDSIDGNGMMIISSVHFKTGYKNAFWEGTQMVYGDGFGFPLADDVVAHELTHGVTQYESDLLYYFQSGAINESLSDVWGEYYDQSNGQGTDTAAVKWLLGENVTGYGAARNMKNPPQFKDPDRIGSSLFYKGFGDNGGVHTNSGVNNKAVYLMVDGGTFNGRTVYALGWDKVAPIYYEVNTNLLGSAANYSDLYYALQQACATLTGQHGITPEDCINVRVALDAVQMNNPVVSNVQITAPLCPSNMISDTNLFKDQMEGALGTKWSASSFRWALSSVIASSPTQSVHGDDHATFLDETLTMNTGIVVQPNSYLHFDHAYDFEKNYDGGVLEYTINNGATWPDAKSLFAAGANYTGTISQYYSSALHGRKAFTGSTYFMVSSLYNLNSLVGQTVKFRFRFATDNYFQYEGWFIDDVQINTCVNLPGIPVLQLPAQGALVKDYTPVLDWSDVVPGLDHYQIQVADNSAFTAPVYDDNSLITSYFEVPSDLTPNTTYYWRVRSFNNLGDTKSWTVARSFRTVIVPPTLTAPADTASLDNRRPFFNWDDVAGATGYQFVLSKQANLSNPLKNIPVLTSEYLPPDLPANTLFYWRVMAKGPNGPSAWSSTHSFTTGNPASTPVLVAPANNALVKDYTPLLDWKNSVVPEGTTFRRYELQVDNNSDFSSLAINIVTTDGVVTESNFTPPSDLTPNTKYFWRVRAVNTVGIVEHFSGWSKVWTFRAAMLAPTLVSPGDTTTVGSLKPTLTWTAVTGATSYTIQIATSSSFGTIVLTKNSSTSDFTLVTNLPKNKTLYWRVRALGPNGPSDWSIPFSFHTPQ